MANINASMQVHHELSVIKLNEGHKTYVSVKSSLYSGESGSSLMTPGAYFSSTATSSSLALSMALPIGLAHLACLIRPFLSTFGE